MNKFEPVKTAPKARRPNRAAWLMTARVWHSYAGAVFAPAILFFSVTGAFQTFNLHKPMPGYHPPATMQALASMHKNQNLKVKYVDDAAAKAGKVDKPDNGPKPPPDSVISRTAQLALKVFAALVSVGLAATTTLGLYMSWQTARRRVVLLCFASGAVLPVVVMLAI